MPSHKPSANTILLSRGLHPSNSQCANLRVLNSRRYSAPSSGYRLRSEACHPPQMNPFIPSLCSRENKEPFGTNPAYRACHDAAHEPIQKYQHPTTKACHCSSVDQKSGRYSPSKIPPSANPNASITQGASTTKIPIAITAQMTGWSFTKPSMPSTSRTTFSYVSPRAIPIGRAVSIAFWRVWKTAWAKCCFMLAVWTVSARACCSSGPVFSAVKRMLTKWEAAWAVSSSSLDDRWMGFG
jgi:hypothetical protein